MPRVTEVIIPTKNNITIMTRQIRMRIKHVLACEKIDMIEVTLIVALIKKSLAQQHLTILNGVKFFEKMFVKILNNCTLALQSRLYKKSVKNQLDEVWKIILDNIVSKNWLDARACLDAAMKLLQYETYFLAANGGNDELNVERLATILDTMLSRTIRRPPVLILFQHYSKFLDVSECTWKVLPTYVKSVNFSNEIFACNFMALVRSCKLNDNKLLRNRYFTYSFEKFEDQFTRKNIFYVWELILKVCNIESISLILHRQIMFALKEVFLVHLLYTQSTIKFLLNSLAMGGSISMPSFEIIYMLTRIGKASVKDIYIGLFCLFDPHNFLFRPNKPRILYMLDLFLCSPELPLRIIVSFVNRLGRLTLHLAKKDLSMVLTLIRILMKRFSHHENVGPHRTPWHLSDERFNMFPSPILAMAFLSSLGNVWDLPVTASKEELKDAAYNIFRGLPIQVHNLSSVLERSDAEAFTSVIRGSINKLSFCYNRSLGFRLQDFEKGNLREYC